MKKRFGSADTRQTIRHPKQNPRHSEVLPHSTSSTSKTLLSNVASRQNNKHVILNKPHVILNLFQNLTSISQNRYNLEIPNQVRDDVHGVMCITKAAFTLAEVLTTLVIIGVIAAITLPGLQSTISDMILEKQKATFNSKLTTGLQNMQLKGALANEYATTDDFVATMKKHMNITKICDQNHLSDCFQNVKQNTKVVKFRMSNIHVADDIFANFAQKNSPINGLVFSDGTSALIAHNPDCVIANRFDTKIKLTSCFSMIYDVNGNEGPNILGQDIDAINLDYGQYNNVYVIGEAFYPASISKDECLKLIDQGAPILSCPANPDYYAGAVKKCFMEGKSLPTAAQMKDVAKQLYGRDVPQTGSVTGLSIADQDLYKKLGSPEPKYFWMGGMSGEIVTLRMFSSTETKTVDRRPGSSSWAYRNYDMGPAFCVGYE